MVAPSTPQLRLEHKGPTTLHKLLHLVAIAVTFGGLSVAQAENFDPTFTPKRQANCVSFNDLRTKWAELGFILDLGFDPQQSKLICAERSVREWFSETTFEEILGNKTID